MYFTSEDTAPQNDDWFRLHTTSWRIVLYSPRYPLQEDILVLSSIAILFIWILSRVINSKCSGSYEDILTCWHIFTLRERQWCNSSDNMGSGPPTSAEYFVLSYWFWLQLGILLFTMYYFWTYLNQWFGSAYDGWFWKCSHMVSIDHLLCSYQNLLACWQVFLTIEYNSLL